MFANYYFYVLANSSAETPPPPPPPLPQPAHDHVMSYVTNHVIKILRLRLRVCEKNVKRNENLIIGKLHRKFVQICKSCKLFFVIKALGDEVFR